MYTYICYIIVYTFIVVIVIISFTRYVHILIHVGWPWQVGPFSMHQDFVELVAAARVVLVVLFPNSFGFS